MYQPKKFEVSEADSLQLIEEHPFATVIAQGTNPGEISTPLFSHLPLLLVPGTPTKLVGHMSRRNPQWQLWQTGGTAVAVFHGPHTYITPNWYEGYDVPTWNYAVVHAEGPVRLIEGPRDLMRILSAMTDRFEGHGPDAWRFGLPEDLQGEGQLAEAIVGFEISVTKLVGKFKLSQNRSEVDRTRVMAGLEGRKDEQSAGVLALMRRHSV